MTKQLKKQKQQKQGQRPNLPDVLAELEMRFLMNLPEAELNDAVRVFMQIEQAHWFYEDFFVDKHKHLKTMKLKKFSQALFQQSAVLSPITAKCDEFWQVPSATTPRPRHVLKHVILPGLHVS